MATDSSKIRAAQPTLATRSLSCSNAGSVLGLCVGALLAAVLPAHGADGTKPVRVLFVLGSPPYHDIRALPPILEKVLDQVGGFQVTRLEPPKDKAPDDPAHLAKLANIKRADYDVLLFYTSRHKLDELQERALQVRRGRRRHCRYSWGLFQFR